MAVVISLNRFMGPVDDTVTALPKSQSHKVRSPPEVTECNTRILQLPDECPLQQLLTSKHAECMVDDDFPWRNVSDNIQQILLQHSSRASLSDFQSLLGTRWLEDSVIAALIDCMKRGIPMPDRGRGGTLMRTGVSEVLIAATRLLAYGDTPRAHLLPLPVEVTDFGPWRSCSRPQDPRLLLSRQIWRRALLGRAVLLPHH